MIVRSLVFACFTALAGCYSSTEPERDAGNDLAGEVQEELSGGLVGSPCTSPDQCRQVPGLERECILEVTWSWESYDYCIEDHVDPHCSNEGGSRDFTFHEGYCSAVCTSDAECGDGAACANLIGRGMCLKRCGGEYHCRPYYHCWNGSLGDYYCVPQDFNWGAD